MAIETTYTSLRADLASALDRVVKDREIIIVRRRGKEDVALVAADELSSLLETAHLLRSPRNARRLLSALHRAESRTLKPRPLADLKHELGLGTED